MKSAVLIAALALPVFGADRQPPGLPVLNGPQPIPTLSKTSLPLPAGWAPQYEQTFTSAKALESFAMTDPAAWVYVPGQPSGALELSAQSQYQPAVRSPVNIALLADRQFGDFILECDLLQTGKEYGHRDMCLFFGLQDPSNFYYVHLATKADDHAHNVFIVHNAPRTKIATKTTKGVEWGLNVWHRVRLERRAKEGTIQVWFDDLTTPLMIAQDTTFQTGHIGFGSFDDTGRVSNIRIWAPSQTSEPTTFYQRP